MHLVYNLGSTSRFSMLLLPGHLLLEEEALPFWFMLPSSHLVSHFINRLCFPLPASRHLHQHQRRDTQPQIRALRLLRYTASAELRISFLPFPTRTDSNQEQVCTILSSHSFLVLYLRYIKCLLSYVWNYARLYNTPRWHTIQPFSMSLKDRFN